MLTIFNAPDSIQEEHTEMSTRTTSRAAQPPKRMHNMTCLFNNKSALGTIRDTGIKAFMYCDLLRKYLSVLEIKNRCDEVKSKSHGIQRSVNLLKLMHRLGFTHGKDESKLDKATFVEDWGRVVDDGSYAMTRLNEPGDDKPSTTNVI